MKGKIKDFINHYKKEVMIFSVFILFFSIFFIGNAFAAFTPVKSVIITSKNTSYGNKEEGSWQVEKSGKWIGKGRARVIFDVDTTLMTENKSTDIIMVLDISGSMSGDKLDRVKQDSTELVDSLLSNGNNQVALITFDTTSTIVSDFTNDKDKLISQINDLQVQGSTNYYQALVNVDNILKDYTKQDNRDAVVLFLTDGYPNVDTPNQITQYQYLKTMYPYITVNGIQYEMGNAILKPIQEVSDDQFFADMETLSNVLFDASVVPIPYEKFEIVDYIDQRYFKLESKDDITVSEGTIKLEEENGKQKITWTIDNFKSGRNAKLTMDINLKEEYIGQGGIYPTNESEEVISSIQGQEEDVNSTLTPVLSDNYQVIYDGNAPGGKVVNNVPKEANYSIFDTVSISNEEPTCAGYEFKGWEIATKGVTRAGDDYFIMPEEDVIIRAKWSKVEIAKSMDGTVNTMGDSIMKRYTSSTTTDYHNSKYKSKITSVVTKDNLDIPANAIEYWDVSAAGDGSVIAYIEDDGSGNGTYKVTIGGQGGIIANPNSSYLFYGSSSSNGFSSLESIDLTYLDTSQVTKMSYMFRYCGSLTNIIFGNNFDTSNVTTMSYMFSGCRSLTSIDLSSFDTSNVTYMSSIFSSCSSLTSLGVSRFDTSKVTNMSSMFSGCSSLTSLDVTSFDTSNVTNMRSMFYSCSGLTSLDVSHFDTSNVTSMSSMFYSCSGLTSVDVSHFDTSKVTNMEAMFRDCSNLTSVDVSHFDTSNVTTMSYMFSGCRSLTSIDLSSFDTSNVTNMSSIFFSCRSLTSLDVSRFDTSKVTNMSSMFSGCSSLTSLDLSNFNTVQVTDMSDMFMDCSSLTDLDVSHFDTSNVTYMFRMFYSCDSLTSLDVSNFDTSKVTNMSAMFINCIRLTSLDMRNADFNSVTSYGNMFTSVNGSINVIVKDSTAQNFIRARLDDAGKTNAMVTIATSTRSLPLSFKSVWSDSLSWL